MRTIHFEGTTHRFPDNATDQEIEEILLGISPPEAPPSPEALPAPAKAVSPPTYERVPRQIASGFLGSVGGFGTELADLAKLLGEAPVVGEYAKAAEPTLRGGAETWQKLSQRVGVEDPNYLEKLFSGFGGAPVGITEFKMGVPWAAVTGYAEGGPKEALRKSIERLLLGFGFKGLGPTTRPIRVPGTAAMFAAAAPEGERLEAAGMGAGFGAFPTGGRTGLQDILGKRPAVPEFPATGLEKFPYRDPTLEKTVTEHLAKLRAEAPGEVGEQLRLPTEIPPVTAPELQLPLVLGPEGVTKPLFRDPKTGRMKAFPVPPEEQLLWDTAVVETRKVPGAPKPARYEAQLEMFPDRILDDTGPLPPKSLESLAPHEPDPQYGMRVNPETIQEKSWEGKEYSLNLLSRLGGSGKRWGRWAKRKGRVPYWHEDLNPLVKHLDNLTGDASEITSQARRRFRALKDHEPSEAMTEAIFQSTLLGKPVGREALVPKEQQLFDSVFSTNEWMLGEFDKLIRKAVTPAGRPMFEAAAKREGISVDEYIDKFMAEHKKPYYFPLLRSDGDHVVYAKLGKDTIWSENFKSPREAEMRAADLRERMPDAIRQARPDADVSGLLVDTFNVRERYGKYNFPILLEMVHDLPYLRNTLKGKGVPDEQIQDMTDILSGKYLEFWARGRLAHRKGIPGFSTDIKAVLDAYTEFFPRSFVRRTNAGKTAQLVESLPQELRDYGKDLENYYLGRTQREGQANMMSRYVIHNYNLALKVAFGLLNFSQRGVTTYWRAVKEVGMVDAPKVFLDAQQKEVRFWADIVKKKFDTEKAINKATYLHPTDKEILLRMRDRGAFEQLRTREITGKSASSRWINIFGIASEKSNRIQSSLVGAEIGRRRGLAGQELFDFAQDFVYKSQWLYSKANRPEIGRGMMAPAFVFKTYIFNDLNFMKDLYPNKKAFAGAVASRLLLGGAMGFYGANILNSMIDYTMEEIVGKADWQLTKEEALRAVPQWALYGLPTTFGLHGSIVFGSPELFSIAGWGLVQRFRNTMNKYLEQGETLDSVQTWRRLLPTAIKHFMGFSTKDIFGKEQMSVYDLQRIPREIRHRAVTMWNATPKEMNSFEKTLYAIGFATKTPSEFWRAIHAIKSASREYKQTKASIHNNIAKELVYGADRIHRGIIPPNLQKEMDRATKNGIILNSASIKKQIGEHAIAKGVPPVKIPEIYQALDQWISVLANMPEEIPD